MGHSFEIGDQVYFRSAASECLGMCTVGKLSLPSCFTITEKITEEYPGGKQYHYRLGGEIGYKPEVLIDLWCNLDLVQYRNVFLNATLPKE